MSKLTTFSHEERPDYQKENIDLAHRLVLTDMSQLWIDNSSWDPNNIRYVDSQWDFAWHAMHDDSIEIDFRFWFNTSVYIHELFHTYSNEERVWIGSDNRSWYCSKNRNRWLNEWLTHLLTLNAIQNNFDAVQNVRRRYRKLMLEHQWLWKKSWDPLFLKFTHWCENTWWFRSYFHEMRLVNAIIDIVAYQRAKNLESLDHHKNKIWNDIIEGYFLWDFNILNALLKEVDTTWNFAKDIEKLQPWDTLCKELVSRIRLRIIEVHEAEYRMEAIPNKLT